MNDVELLLILPVASQYNIYDVVDPPGVDIVMY